MATQIPKEENALGLKYVEMMEALDKQNVDIKFAEKQKNDLQQKIFKSKSDKMIARHHSKIKSLNDKIASANIIKKQTEKQISSFKSKHCGKTIRCSYIDERGYDMQCSFTFKQS